MTAAEFETHVREHRLDTRFELPRDGWVLRGQSGVDRDRQGPSTAGPPPACRRDGRRKDDLGKVTDARQQGPGILLAESLA